MTGVIFLETGLTLDIRVFLESCNFWSICKARDLRGTAVVFALSEGDASQALRRSLKGLQAADCRLYLRSDVESGESGSSCPGVTADLTDLLL